MRITIKISILFLLHIIVFRNYAENNSNINLSRFTVENGLSDNKITLIFQDSKGYIWIGTKDGLNRYNGYEFEVFKNHYGDSNSISDNYITSISEDSDGNIWIGTMSGLNMLNKKEMAFTRYLNIKYPNSISSDQVLAVSCDDAGNIYVKSNEAIDKINRNSDKIDHFQFYNNYFNEDQGISSSGIYIDKNKNLWIGTKDGLNYYDRTLEQFKRFYYDAKNNKSISNDHVNAIIEDEEQNLWIGTNYGLNLYDRNNNIFFRKYINKKNPQINFVTDIYPYKDDNIIVGTKEGLFIYNNKNGIFQSIKGFYNSSKLQELDNVCITCIKIDNSGIIWIGTENNGLIKINENGKKFNTYSSATEQLKFLENNISSVYVDEKNDLWIGTRKSGLYCIDRKTLNVKVKFNVTSDNTINPISYINAINTNEIIIGTNNGVYIHQIDANNQPVVYLNNSILQNNRINSILISKDSAIWLATEEGLIKFINDSVIQYQEDSDENKISNNKIFALTEDSDSNIWVGTEKGLNKINILTNEIVQFYSNNTFSNIKLSDDRIYSLLYDSLNTLWIGTSNGLNKLDLKTNNLTVLTEFDGLANNVIYSLQKDDSGNLWLSTNKGISRIDKKNNEILNFDIIDGVHGYDFLINGSYKTKQGELFFSGFNGVDYFNPKLIYLNKSIPNIVITAFELYNKYGKTRFSLQNGDTVLIPLESNHFTIEFAALDYTRPEKSNYAYKLEGIEDDWINIGNNRKATFSNIPSGSYYFRVKGSNNDNFWNNDGTSLYLIVETSFWRSKYAFILYLILFLFILYLLFQYRTKSLRKSNKILRDKELAGLEIKKQREELILKNKNITDSINYAKRIQEAIMPSEKFFKRILPSSFILYMPKDIVSGDFYWIAESNNKIFLAVVDCTGHGVPGAFMSLIGFELLRNITLVQKIEDPSEVLNMLNTGVAHTFNKEEQLEYIEVKDGMDMSFCVINKETKILEYAGAYNPLYLVRDNKIIELKGDHYTVGLLKEDQSYTKHIAPLEGVDMIYLFTDGYTDQFGGLEEKKYKYRRFRHLLLTIHKLIIPKQRLFLKESIEKWKGDLEQVDDILVIGVNPKEI